MLSSLAPLSQPGHDFFQGITAKSLTIDAFNPKSMMVKCDPSLGHYMASCMMYRGDIMPPDVAKAVAHIKDRSLSGFKDRKFVKWCPTGFKIGINEKRMVTMGDEMSHAPSSAVMIGNNTAITVVFTRIDKKYDLMFEKRAFVHWFIQDGMEDGEFPDAREAIDMLRDDYAEVVQLETALQSNAGSAKGEDEGEAPRPHESLHTLESEGESDDEISDF